MLECLAIDGTGVNAFAHNAKVLAINHLTGEVIYSHISIAGFCNGEFHSSVVDSGIGEEANTVGTGIPKRFYGMYVYLDLDRMAWRGFKEERFIGTIEN